MDNPGNERTFTLSEMLTAEVIDAIDDRIETLEDNLANAVDIHTEAELAYFRESAANLREARAILDQ